MTTFLVLLAEKAPPDNKVVAGWGGFAMFAGLCIAVALLGMSLVKHLRKARENFGVDETGSLKDSPKRLERERSQDAPPQ